MKASNLNHNNSFLENDLDIFFSEFFTIKVGVIPTKDAEQVEIDVIIDTFYNNYYENHKLVRDTDIILQMKEKDYKKYELTEKSIIIYKEVKYNLKSTHSISDGILSGVLYRAGKQ